MGKKLITTAMAGLMGLASGCGFPGSPDAIRYWEAHPEEREAMMRKAQASTQASNPAADIANFFSVGLLGVVGGAHYAGAIRNYDAARKAVLMGRGMQMIGNSNVEHYVHHGDRWPASQPVQQYQQGAWVTDLKVDFYSFLWNDHNNNGNIDWAFVEEVGERKKEVGERKNNFSVSRERTGLCLDIKCAKPGQSFSVKLYEGDRFINESNLEANSIGGFISMFPVNFNKPGYYTINVTTGGKKVKEVGINVVP